MLGIVKLSGQEKHDKDDELSSDFCVDMNYTRNDDDDAVC